MDHVHILVIEFSSVILGQTKYGKRFIKYKKICIYYSIIYKKIVFIFLQ